MGTRKDELNHEDETPSFKEALKDAEHKKPEADQASQDLARTPAHQSRGRQAPRFDRGENR